MRLSSRLVCTKGHAMFRHSHLRQHPEEGVSALLSMSLRTTSVSHARRSLSGRRLCRVSSKANQETFSLTFLGSQIVLFKSDFLSMVLYTGSCQLQVAPPGDSCRCVTKAMSSVIRRRLFAFSKRSLILTTDSANLEFSR